MDNTDKKALEDFACKAARSIKSDYDLDDFRKMLTKVTVETELNAELDEHLSYQRNHAKTDTSSSAGKSIVTDHGEIDTDVPRYREVSF